MTLNLTILHRAESWKSTLNSRFAVHVNNVSVAYLFLNMMRGRLSENKGHALKC